MVKKTICKQCGAVNILDQMPESGDFFPCKLPEGLDGNPEAENGLLQEGEEQARDLEHPKKQSRSRAE